nr:glycosyltransferase family 39 protein [Chloroflexota bacterium]
MKKAEAVKPAYLFGVMLLLIARLGLQVLLYRSGFKALTADEFGRTVLAARWAQSPYMAWYGAWLPFHMYIFGTALLLEWNLLCVPRVITVLLGVISIVLMYQLTSSLFESRETGLVSAVLLAVNPIHTWLSSTPLTGMPQTTLVLASTLGFTLYLKSKRQRYVYISAFMLALANGFRYESWMVSIVFSLYLIGEGILHFWRKDSDIRQLLTLMVAASIPWVFPLGWIIGNYMETGNPLYFLASVKSYKLTWYGESRSYNHYLQTFLKIDPYATALGVLGLLICLLRCRKSRAIQWYVAMAVIPFSVFAYLHGGQIEPQGNFFRYLALFIFISYPGVACLIDLGINFVAKSQTTRMILLVLILGIMVTTQTRATFQFVNDPAADGLEVGRGIRLLRSEHSDLSQRPMLIELSYWQYLAIHVGANDISLLVYDRELDFERRQSSSLLLTDVDAFCSCLALYNISYIIVKSPELRDVVENDLAMRPSEEINNYVFYEVPES